ncbi:MAG: hypothetical protein MJZ64_02945 [Paludibacteraceae bacterium]|nr:hypothetical protein [Paludibacteraceae bacterium]
MRHPIFKACGWYYGLWLTGMLVLSSCTHRPSAVEQMRLEKARKDSLTYVRAQQNMHYSDSVLQLLLPRTDSMLTSFVYSKDEKNEDYGHYVHRLLQTTGNASRNYLQAYVSDNRQTSVQSYYFGSVACRQQTVRVEAGEDFVEEEGSNHAFEAEGWHEILTIDGENANRILAFISSHPEERIRVTALDVRHEARCSYYLSNGEKQALADTYRLAVLMSNIDALERAIHVSDLQIKKYEKKHPERK